MPQVNTMDDGLTDYNANHDADRRPRRAKALLLAMAAAVALLAGATPASALAIGDDGGDSAGGCNGMNGSSPAEGFSTDGDDGGGDCNGGAGHTGCPGVGGVITVGLPGDCKGGS